MAYAGFGFDTKILAVAYFLFVFFHKNGVQGEKECNIGEENILVIYICWLFEFQDKQKFIVFLNPPFIVT